MLLPTRTSSTVTRRVRYYTRKLAEIERFMETQGMSADVFAEQPVTVHRYWQSDLGEVRGS